TPARSGERGTPGKPCDRTWCLLLLSLCRGCESEKNVSDRRIEDSRLTLVRSDEAVRLEPPSARLVAERLERLESVVGPRVDGATNSDYVLHPIPVENQEISHDRSSYLLSMCRGVCQSASRTTDPGYWRMISRRTSATDSQARHCVSVV